MTGKREVKVVISGDADGLHKELKRSTKDVTRFGDETGKTGKRMGAVLGLLAGGAAAAAIGGFFSGGLNDIKAAEKASAQTAAVIKSTGAAAGQSQAHIEDLADSIEKMSGVEAENVQAGQNMLLTFTNIKGTNFDEATKTMVDMSVAMGTDAKGQAIALGKALNDPIKGVAALGRVGVTFTDQQKGMIQKLQETGDMAGAQKVILAELSKEFGGSAKAAGETLGGKLEILKAKFGDVRQGLVEQMLPALTSLMSFVTNTALPAFAGLATFLTRNKDVIVPLVAILGGLAAAVWAVNTVARVYTATQAALNFVMLANPIGLVVLAVAALAGGLYLAYRKSETFRDIVQGAFQAVSTAATVMWDKGVRPALKFIVDAWMGVVGALVSGAASAFGWVPGLGAKLKSAAKAFNEFRDQVNDSLDGIHESVHVKVTASFAGRKVDTNSLAGMQRYATGTRSARRGVALVGEEGPELLKFGGGEEVIPTHELARLAAGRAAGARSAGSGATAAQDQVVQVRLFLDGREIHQSMLRLKRTRGGGALGLA